MNFPTIYELVALPMLFAQEAEDVGGGGAEEGAAGGGRRLVRQFVVSDVGHLRGMDLHNDDPPQRSKETQRDASIL